MIPILYKATETEFKTNGIGRLSDAVSCTVTEVRNGNYKLSMQYPANGRHAKHIRPGNIVFATHDSRKKPQPFDIVSADVDMQGLIQVEAQHISRRLKYARYNFDVLNMGGPILNMESLTEGLQNGTDGQGANKYIAGVWPFTCMSDIDDDYIIALLGLTDEDTLSPPPFAIGGNVYDTLLSSSDGMLTRKVSMTASGDYLTTGYGDCGDYLFDMYDVKLLKDRGQDNGVKLRTGVNVRRMVATHNDTEAITAAMPVWTGADAITGQRASWGLRDLEPESDGVVYGDTSYGYHRVALVDLSGVFEQKPTSSEMRREAARYLKEHSENVESSYVSYSVDIVPSNVRMAYIQSADLCDTVTVEDEASGTWQKLKVVEVTYDVLADMYTHIVVGRREKTVPELLERKNQVWIDKTEKSLTQVSDTAKKATVTNKVYPTTYDPANPGEWDDTATGPLYDSTGRELEQVATINRQPVFAPKGGGSGGVGLYRVDSREITHRFMFAYNETGYTNEAPNFRLRDSLGGQSIAVASSPLSLSKMMVGARYTIAVNAAIALKTDNTMVGRDVAILRGVATLKIVVKSVTSTQVTCDATVKSFAGQTRIFGLTQANSVMFSASFTDADAYSDNLTYSLILYPMSV